MSALNELYDSIRCYEKCEIARSRVKVVPGEGAEDAEIMFIGEAPGFYEDQQGRPFVDPAGKFLMNCWFHKSAARRSISPPLSNAVLR